MTTPRKILVPVDFGELSDVAVEAAVELASKLGASVTVLHVHGTRQARHGSAFEPVHAEARLRPAAEVALAALVERHRSGGAPIEGVLREGTPWSVTLDHARESHADMIVLGAPGKRGLSRALLGSVAEKIVQGSPIPVLTLRGAPSARSRATANAKDTEKAAVIPVAASHEEEILTLSGAIAGAATGALAGPPGIVAGTVLGAAIGMAAGKTLDDEDAQRHVHDEELDRAIGVAEGDLGAAQPDQPPSRVGAFSSASAGVAGSPSTPSEGPLQNIDED